MCHACGSCDFLHVRLRLACSEEVSSDNQRVASLQAAAGNPVLKAALTTGALSLAGDLLAQTFTIRRQQVNLGHPPSPL